MAREGRANSKMRVARSFLLLILLILLLPNSMSKIKDQE